MDVLQILHESLTFRELGRGLLLAFVLAQFQSHSLQPKDGAHTRKPTWLASIVASGGYFFIFLLARSWLALVDSFVPEPYMDEFFHIPQAQTYCQGRYFDWDDKITTPPGLYLLSVAYHKIWMLAECTAFSLRGLNAFAIMQIALLASVCRNKIEAMSATKERKSAQPFSLYAYHTAINIALFPALFFFSALYYTDVFSTLVVLACYHNHLSRVSQKEEPSLLNDLWTILLGVGALFMRQTNVFWVVVYMGGLEAAHAIHLLIPKRTRRKQPVTNLTAELVRDVPLSITWPDDLVLCAVTLALAAAFNPVKVLRLVWPYVVIFFLFVAFVIWNGSVVLGDKTNHVATIHLSQMQYIWPLFAFFSAPLLVAPFMTMATTALSTMQNMIHGKETASTPKRTEQVSKSSARVIRWVIDEKYYYVPYLFGTIVLSLAVVKYNTIIHPFTLADNRHYMFYIFRYTVLRPGMTRYFLVVAYTISRWLVWARMAGYAPISSEVVRERRGPTSLQPAPAGEGEPKSHEAKTSAPENDPTSSCVVGTLDEPGSTSASSSYTSAALLWLLTTALSLISAPLVEPRYFILPWLFWRLLVPAWPVYNASRNVPWQKILNVPLLKQMLEIGQRVDLMLAVETIWFIAINVGTMYMFLFRPYVWRSSDGEILDGGRLQRFIW